MVILLKRVQLSLFLGLGTQLAVLDHLWVEEPIYGKVTIVKTLIFLYLKEDNTIS